MTGELKKILDPLLDEILTQLFENMEDGQANISFRCEAEEYTFEGECFFRALVEQAGDGYITPLERVHLHPHVSISALRIFRVDSETGRSIPLAIKDSNVVSYLKEQIAYAFRP